MKSLTALAFAILLLTPAQSIASDTLPPGDVDLLFGPAILVNQGVGSTEEIRAALRPNRMHEVLSRLSGQWRVKMVTEKLPTPSIDVVEVRALLDGAWFEMRLLKDGQMSGLVHLGHDGYRGHFAMWEIGKGFTSPQIRVGAWDVANNKLRFWRQFTIRRRGVETLLQERVTLTFESTDVIRWQTFETIGRDAERPLRDLRLTR